MEGGEKRAQQAKELSNILREHIFALFAGGAGYYIIKNYIFMYLFQICY